MKLAALLIIVLSGCATGNRISSGPVQIEFAGVPGTSSDTRYYSHARIKSYSEGQMLRDRQEVVEFTVRSEIQAFDAQKKVLNVKVSTIQKDGTVSLHDMAFPEFKETIDYMIRTTGEVLSAGRYSPYGIFFVPSLPIPKRAVEVGDTWPLEHTWFSSHDQIPLKLQSVGVLKGLVPCEGDKTCAEIEVSGQVRLVTPPTAQGAKYSSRIWGRVLFSLQRGDVIWSEIRSAEEMGVVRDRLTVLSCLRAQTVLPNVKPVSLACDPADEPVNSIPPM